MTTIYLPQISTGPTPTPQGEQDATELLAELLWQHPSQARVSWTLHPLLCEVAETHCLDMASRGYVGHVDPDGRGPNWRLRNAGYVLPEWYGTHDGANNCESLAWGGDGRPRVIYDMWLISPAHRAHVLGEGMYGAQTAIGLAHVEIGGSAWRHYWALISCPPLEVL